MTITSEAPERLTNAREWLATQPQPGEFNHALVRLLDSLMMLHDLREITEEMTKVVECADTYDVEPSEIETARQYLALQHRIVDSVVYELAGYIPGSYQAPEWLQAIRPALYGVLATEQLAHAIHAHDAFRRMVTS